jgi:hypothetical protein
MVARSNGRILSPIRLADWPSENDLFVRPQNPEVGKSPTFGFNLFSFLFLDSEGFEFRTQNPHESWAENHARLNGHGFVSIQSEVKRLKTDFRPPKGGRSSVFISSRFSAVSKCGLRGFEFETSKPRKPRYKYCVQLNGQTFKPIRLDLIVRTTENPSFELE